MKNQVAKDALVKNMGIGVTKIAIPHVKIIVIKIQEFVIVVNKAIIQIIVNRNVLVVWKDVLKMEENV